ncbi:MAG: four helix bundle protein [Candidatus Veblenbacteria bacterium]|nr:four helix bundle protein [Candidatus Veblenbacteria bacterium]MDZ4229738.1 four helix bundle protein [Candidatus Veblenbacteria bacterium]
MENPKIHSFKDLVVWQKAIELAVIVYQLTQKFPNQETYGLVSQLRRAAVSVSSNIAEGFTRSSRREKVQFYAIARGSLAEVESQLELARRVGYVPNNDYHACGAQLEDVRRLLGKFVSAATDKP